MATLESSVDTRPSPVPMVSKTSLPNVAYFCMELAIDQSLHIYSGGLGFLAGSYLRSAGRLDMPMVAVSILWSLGYGDQQIGGDGNVEIVYNKRDYDFLKDIGVTVEVPIFGRSVKARVLLLGPAVFGTVPVYFLTTDIPENSEEDRYLTAKLYDGDERIRISQEILLGVGGIRALKAVGYPMDILHMNEGHALPAVFELLSEPGANFESVRDKTVFTTHTPVAAGNETHDAHLLNEAGFFGKVSLDEAIGLGGGQNFSLTVAALRMSRRANGVSQLHGVVANNMWQWVDGRCPIVAITNAVSLEYWQDNRFRPLDLRNDDALHGLKRQMKQELLDYVAQTTGKQFDPDVLTVVWARRFTEYKRPNLIFRDMDRIKRLLEGHNAEGRKLQLIFSGKFHPNDTTGRDMFNQILHIARENQNVVVLTGPGYELDLSARLKKGADVWLNTPTRPLEASGTSGMSANLNATVHCSIYDGWAVEGTYSGVNGYLINHNGCEGHQQPDVRQHEDYESMMSILENEIVPTYYGNKPRWAELMRQSIHTAASYFNSDRMIIEYYVRLYQSVSV